MEEEEEEEEEEQCPMPAKKNIKTSRKVILYEAQTRNCDTFLFLVSYFPRYVYDAVARFSWRVVTFLAGFATLIGRLVFLEGVKGEVEVEVEMEVEGEA